MSQTFGPMVAGGDVDQGFTLGQERQEPDGRQGYGTTRHRTTLTLRAGRAVPGGLANASTRVGFVIHR